MKKVIFLWPPQPMFYGSIFKHITHIGETIDYCNKHSNATIDFIDAGVQMFSQKYLAMRFSTADILVIYCETYTIDMSLKMARMAKQVNHNIRIIGFGKACCYLPKMYLESKYYDAIVPNGHWEKPICDFINEEDERQSAYYLTPKGEVGSLYRLKPNEWGQPAIDKLPIEKYFAMTGKRQLEICVNKGCPYNCSFCSEKFVYGKSEARRSISDIIEYIEKTHNLCDQYYFDATTFTYDKKWVKALCAALLELPYKVKWCTVTRLDEIDEDLIFIMGKAGCFRLSLGVETLSQKLQCQIHKPIDENKLLKAILMMKANGVRPRLLLIIGLPGQSRDDILYTHERLQEQDVDIRFKEYAPYNDILRDGVSLDVIQRFDRTIICNGDTMIEGIDEELYTKLVFLDKGR